MRRTHRAAGRSGPAFALATVETCGREPHRGIGSRRRSLHRGEQRNADERHKGLDQEPDHGHGGRGRNRRCLGRRGAGHHRDLLRRHLGDRHQGVLRRRVREAHRPQGQRADREPRAVDEPGRGEPGQSARPRPGRHRAEHHRRRRQGSHRHAHRGEHQAPRGRAADLQGRGGRLRRVLRLRRLHHRLQQGHGEESAEDHQGVRRPHHRRRLDGDPAVHQLRDLRHGHDLGAGGYLRRRHRQHPARHRHHQQDEGRAAT